MVFGVGKGLLEIDLEIDFGLAKGLLEIDQG